MEGNEHHVWRQQDKTLGSLQSKLVNISPIPVEKSRVHGRVRVCIVACKVRWREEEQKLWRDCVQEMYNMTQVSTA